ncbi:MAG: hypothetical protein AB1403_12255 [Candidatus Riflebacteria bacterium]
MFAKTFRGSLFLTFMLIASMTLTGCSMDIGQIISGLQNVVGDLGGKLGGFIDKGLSFAKDFIGKAKDFVSPILDAGKEIFKDFAPVAEKIQDGFGKVTSVFDKVGNVGNQIKEVTSAIADAGKDSSGDDIDTDAPTSDIVNSPDDEDAEITIKPDEENGTGDSSADEDDDEAEVSTESEIRAQAAVVADGTKKISEGVSSIADQLKNLKMTDAEKKALTDKIKKIKDNLDKIRKDPTSKEAKALFESSKKDVESVIAEAKKFGDIAKGTIDSLKKVVDDTKNAFGKFEDAISSIKNLFK